MCRRRKPLTALTILIQDYSSRLFFQIILPDYSSRLFFQIILPDCSSRLFFQVILPDYSSRLFFQISFQDFLLESSVRSAAAEKGRFQIKDFSSHNNENIFLFNKEINFLFYFFLKMYSYYKEKTVFL